MIGPRLTALGAGALAVLRQDVREGLAGNAGRLLLSHLVRLALGIVASALIARSLGPERLGTFAVLGAAVMIAGTVADMGMTGSAVRRIAGLLPTAPAAARASAGGYARLRLLSALLVCAAAFLLARPLAGLLGLPEGSGAPWIRIGGVAVLTASVSGAVTAILHAQRRYRALLIIQSGISAAGVALIGILFLLGRLSIATALAAGAAASATGFGIALVLLPAQWRRTLPRGPLWNEETRTLFAFGRWLWIGAIFSIVAAQLDLLLVHRWLTPELVGLYALAFALALKADLVNQILHTLLLPAASGLSTREAYVAFGRRGFARGVLLALPLLLLLPLARPFISLVYGVEYAPAAGVFSALLVVVVFDLLTQPLLLLPFPMNLPRLIAAADAARVAALLVCGALLIPAFGLYGAVGAKLAARVIGALIIGIPVGLRLGRPLLAPAPPPDADRSRAAPSPEAM